MNSNILSSYNAINLRSLDSNIAINAKNDVEAASTWLRAKGSQSSNTFESYRRVITRLLLWLDERNLSLKDLKVEHAHAYYVHLTNPPPHWIKPRKSGKHIKLLPTQTITGPLTSQSINYTRTVLGQLFTYLQEAGYLQRNVFKLSMKPPVLTETLQTRYLDLTSWQWLWAWILNLPEGNDRDQAHKARTRWVFSLLYHTGIRREEAANARMCDFVRRDQFWTLHVIGKGSKEKFVTVNSSLLQELVLFRRSLGLADFPAPTENAPLVMSIHENRRNKPLTPRSLGLLVHTIAMRAAKDCIDPHCRAQIEKMTTHYMRHTNATHRLMAGASLESTQDELGHADPRTTRIYAKINDQRRREDAEKLAQFLIVHT